MINKKILAAAVAAAYPQTQDWPTDSSRINTNCDLGNDSCGDEGLGLDNYLSTQDEVKLLRVEVERLTKRLKSEIKLKSAWRCKYEKLKPSRLVETEKKKQAIDMIVAFDNGDKSKSLADIARQLGIKYQTLTSIARAYRQAII
jgi:hypothetical protein